MAKKNNHKRYTRNKQYKNKPTQKPVANETSVMTMPLEFARELIRQTTNNPRNNTGRKTYSYSIYSKENILNWLQNPASSTNEKNLRNASNYMYVASMHYNRLLNYYAGLYCGAYVLAPLSFDKSEIKANLDKQYKRVSKAVESMNIPQMLRSEILVALREGAFYGIILKDNNSAFVHKIDPDYCKITAICDGSYVYKVDMTKIKDNLEFYPDEFTKMYAEYIRTGDQWQEVPLELSVCLKADDTIPDYSIPPFAAVMPSVYTIANTESLQETAGELKNYKMITGQIPTDDEGNPLMDDGMVTRYYNQISNALGENVGLAITPFKLDQFSFENKTTQDVDDISKATSNFWSNAGTSGLLHGKENDTSGVARLAIKNDETYILGLVQQFERIINRYLKTGFSGTTKFKITILPITVFNKEEYLKYYKESATLGIAKLHYAVALGIPQNDLAAINYIEENFMPFDDLKPLRSSYTESNKTGRPKSSDSDLSDSGEATRDNDSNQNR